jgi:hypothetical protein
MLESVLARFPRTIAVGAFSAGIFGVGVAVAAAFGITSASLTVSTGASSIAATTCSLNAAPNDSYVSQASPSSTFGTATTMNVRSSLSANMRAFVQFSLASCSIPANALITVGELKLFMNSPPTASRTYEAHRVTASWAETTVTWTNQPAVAASATASVATGTTSSVTLKWNVTSDVQAFVDTTASNFGWRIKDQTEDAATARTGQFRSAEYGTISQRPVLDISYYP